MGNMAAEKVENVENGCGGGNHADAAPVINSAANTIRVKTSRFGEVEVDAGRVITMTSPFLGFPESNRFYLQAHGPKSPFMWLQSLDNPDLAFVVIQPTVINPKYNPAIGSHVKEELRVQDDHDLDIMLILTIPQGRPEAMTANLLGPVVINVRQKLGRQILLDPLKYESCWPVLQ